MKNIEKKRLNKLNKVNVPELFYGKFIASLPDTQSIVAKLKQTTPSPRGRGMSRVVTNLTNTEWNDLYQIAAAGRARMIGADRNTELRPTICAKSLAYRMEDLGVDNLVSYTPKKIYTRLVGLVDPDVGMDDEMETPVANTIPATPLTIDKVTDLQEIPAEEQDVILDEIQRFINS
jgi:hypothetical protein